MKILREFREFALRGNVIDLAIGVIIGAAFGRIVTSLVEDLLNPLLGLLAGGEDLAERFLVLGEGEYATLAEAQAAGAATLNYGAFANAVVHFTIVAAALFLFVRQVNRLQRRPAEQVAPTMRDCPECLATIPRLARRCRFCAEPVPAAG